MERRVIPQQSAITDSQEDKHLTRMVWINDAVKSRAQVKKWGRFKKQESSRTVRRRLKQYGLSVRGPWFWLPLTLYLRLRVPPIVYWGTNLDTRMALRRVFRWISILLTASWWSNPCLAASWRTYFASLHSASSYWPITWSDDMGCNWITRLGLLWFPLAAFWTFTLLLC